jgi:hypothetical protein
MTEPLPKKVVIVAHSERVAIMVGLARRFKRNGAEVALVCTTEQERAFYASRFGEDFQRIVVANGLYATVMEPVTDEAAIIAKAVETEAWLGKNINRLALSDRHFGRGFALGGTRHPRSRYSEQTSYPQVLRAYCTMIDFWREFVEAFQPELMVGDSTILEAVAERMGIPIRILVSSRYENFFYWSTSVLRNSPAIEESFHTVARDGEAALLDRPYKSHLAFRKKFLEDATLWGVTRKTGYVLAQNLYWLVRRYEKRRGYYLWDLVAYFWNKRADLRALRPPVTRSLADMKGKPFVFFPLHTEPETALQGMSAEFMFQLEAIAAIARDLPAGVTLVVKEAYHALGRRPRDFHRQILSFKNVVLLDTMEFGLDVVKEAAVTATITGTAGYEAAILGKPVITFGQHNIYGFLDHVHVVSDLSDLRPILTQCLDPDADTHKATEDGAHFLKALLSISFDLGSFDALNPGSVDDDAMDAVFDGLRTSLALQRNRVE